MGDSTTETALRRSDARHLERAWAALPKGVETVYARADSGFYCWEAVESYEKHRCRFIISARKTARLVEELKAAEWQPSPRTDARPGEFAISRRDGAKSIASWRCAT